MFKFKIFLSMIFVSGLAVAALNLTEQSDSSEQIEKSSESQEFYWSCYSLDNEQNIFSGWSVSLAKAKKAALENCSTFTDVDGACVLSEDPCEQLEF